MDRVTKAQKQNIIDSLKDPVQNIFIAAKHTSELRDIDFKGQRADELSVEEVKIIATRYNRGPHLRLKEIEKNMSYGKSISKRKDHLEGLLND